MAFFNSAVQVLQTLVIALGAGLSIWGGINLMEGYSDDCGTKHTVSKNCSEFENSSVSREAFSVSRNRRFC